MEKNRGRMIWQRATRPMTEWSRQVIAGAERRAAKGLWLASTRLGRIAYRLDKAGLALSVEGGGASGRRNGTRPSKTGAGKDVELLPEEACTPHLA